MMFCLSTSGNRYIVSTRGYERRPCARVHEHHDASVPLSAISTSPRAPTVVPRTAVARRRDAIESRVNSRAHLARVRDRSLVRTLATVRAIEADDATRARAFGRRDREPCQNGPWVHLTHISIHRAVASTTNRTKLCQMTGNIYRDPLALKTLTHTASSLEAREECRVQCMRAWS